MKKKLITLAQRSILVAFALSGQVYAQPTASLTPAPAAPAITKGYPDFADLVERASPAVVNIRTTEKVMVQQQGSIPGMPEDQAEFFRPSRHSARTHLPAAPRNHDRGNGLLPRGAVAGAGPNGS